MPLSLLARRAARYRAFLAKRRAFLRRRRVARRGGDEGVFVDVEVDQVVVDGVDATPWAVDYVRRQLHGARGVRLLAASVPVATGALSRSMTVEERGDGRSFRVGTNLPHAPNVIYRRDNRYGAYRVRMTLDGWAQSEVEAIKRAARAYAIQRARRGQE